MTDCRCPRTLPFRPGRRQPARLPTPVKRAVKILVREVKLLTAAYQRVPTRPAPAKIQEPKRPYPEGSPIRWPSPIPRMLSPIPDTPPCESVPDEVIPADTVPEKDETTPASIALGDFIQGYPNPDYWEPWVVEALQALRPAGVGGRVRLKLPVAGGGWVRVTLPKPWSFFVFFFPLFFYLVCKIWGVKQFGFLIFVEIMYCTEPSNKIYFWTDSPRFCENKLMGYYGELYYIVRR